MALRIAKVWPELYDLLFAGDRIVKTALTGTRCRFLINDDIPAGEVCIDLDEGFTVLGISCDG